MSIIYIVYCFFQYKINNNGVIGKSRNLGITKSSGQWIAFLDSDDIWYKDKDTWKIKDFLIPDWNWVEN